MEEITKLDQKLIDQLRKQPIIESRISLSEDGKWMVHKTIITDIKSVNYIREVLKE